MPLAYRAVGLEELKLPSGVGVGFLYQPGELEGGRKLSHWPCVVPECVSAWSVCHQAWWTCIVSFVRRWCPTAGICSRGGSGGAQGHEATSLDITEELIYESIHFSCPRWQGNFMPTGQRVHPIFSYPSLRVEEWEWDLIKMLPIDAVLLWSQDIHTMAEGLFSEESLLMLLMPDVCFQNILFYVNFISNRVQET